MTAKSHFNVPSRHLFETNEHLVNENLSPCNWRMISSMRSEATRVAPTVMGEDFTVMSRGQRERNKHWVTGRFRPWFYATVCPRVGLWGCRSAGVDAFVEPKFGVSLPEYAALHCFRLSSIPSTPIWQQVLTVLELHFNADCMRGRQSIPGRKREGYSLVWTLFFFFCAPA